MNIKDFVAKDNYTFFDSFRAGVFYYNVYKVGSDIGYQFQVPLDDIGGSTIMAEEKSITMMRYIRKSIDSNTFIKL
jgi:hypothetical protein